MYKTRYIVISVVGVTFLLLLAIVIFFFLRTAAPSDVAIVAQNQQPLTSEAEVALQEQIAPIIKAGDMSACDQVQNSMYRSVCINNIALQKAEATNDISYCQYLDGELISKEDCERQVIMQKSVETENINACQETVNVALQKECTDSFNIRMAIEKNDPTLCAGAEDSVSCQDMVAFNNFSTNQGNIECSAFSSEEAINDCKIIKPIIRADVPNMSQLMTSCSNIKSPAFVRICAGLGVNNQPLPSQQ